MEVIVKRSKEVEGELGENSDRNRSSKKATCSKFD
jgi:hypothetical protein